MAQQLWRRGDQQADTDTPGARSVLVHGHMRAFVHVSASGGWSRHRVKPWGEDPNPPTFEDEVAETRDVNVLETTRAETASSSYPALVNNEQEETRFGRTLDRYRRPYPLLRVPRKEASVFLLLVYLIRVVAWRLFFSRPVLPPTVDAMQVNPHRVTRPK